MPPNPLEPPPVATPGTPAAPGRVLPLPAGAEEELEFHLPAGGDPPVALEIEGIDPPSPTARVSLPAPLPPGPGRVRLRLPLPPRPGLYRLALVDAAGRPLDALRLVACRHDPRAGWVEPEDPARAGLPPPAHGQASPADEVLARVDTFDSSFFDEHYTPAKARDAIRRLFLAARDRRPFSLVRLGDNEVRLLAWGRIPLPAERPLGEAAEFLELHLGVNPARLTTAELDALRDELLAASREADVLGTHRHTVNRDWAAEADRVLSALGLPYGDREVDVAWNAEILDRGFLLPLLGMGRVLLVGNPASRWARMLADPGWRERYAPFGAPRREVDLAGAIFVPHEGTAALEGLPALWKEVRRHRFDIALVAASVVGKLLVGRIRREIGAVALDIGWNMQFLSDTPSPVGAARQPGRRGFRYLFAGRGEPGGIPVDGPRD